MPPRFRLSPRRIFFPHNASTSEWSHLTPIGTMATDDLEAMALVLDAIGIEHYYDDRSGVILVAQADADQARLHWQAYGQENHAWPTPPPARSPNQPGTPPTLALMGLLTVFFLHTGSWQHGNPWFEHGAVNAEAILEQRQWWRLITALTLHADLVHLAGNCLIGGLVIHLLCKVLGYGSAWLLLLLAGAGGNLLNVVFRQGPHFSVGLSTSVFAAIGLLTGLQVVRSRTRSLRNILLPLGAGAGLLAFLGSEGVRTDLGAHLFGFLVGIGVGVVAGLAGMGERTVKPVPQLLLLLLTLTMVLSCWLLAQA